MLASMSPLLANLLAEAEGPETALMLPEVKAEDMRLLLQFIYQGEVVLPPRRTAALLDLAAQLCVAGVRGGGGPAPPSPPRSDSPELDSSDRNAESEDQVSDDGERHESASKMDTSHETDGEGDADDEIDADVDAEEAGEEPDDAHADGVDNIDRADVDAHRNNEQQADDETTPPSGDKERRMSDDESSNEGPMNLAAKPEVRTLIILSNDLIKCSTYSK